MSTATITREKEYQRHPAPGSYAWRWVYAVTVPGEKYPFRGYGLQWARDIAKKKGATKIVEAWR